MNPCAYEGSAATPPLATTFYSLSSDLSVPPLGSCFSLAHPEYNTIDPSQKDSEEARDMVLNFKLLWFLELSDDGLKKVIFIHCCAPQKCDQYLKLWPES